MGNGWDRIGPSFSRLLSGGDCFFLSMGFHLSLTLFRLDWAIFIGASWFYGDSNGFFGDGSRHSASVHSCLMSLFAFVSISFYYSIFFYRIFYLFTGFPFSAPVNSTWKRIGRRKHRNVRRDAANGTSRTEGATGCSLPCHNNTAKLGKTQ